MLIWLTPGPAWTGSMPPTCHKSLRPVRESGCRMGATAGWGHLAARMSVRGFGMTAPLCTFSPALVSISYLRPESPPHSAGGSDMAELLDDYRLTPVIV
jgi:hypothetical protein